jgi:hypothetical protein
MLKEIKMLINLKGLSMERSGSKKFKINPNSIVNATLKPIDRMIKSSNFISLFLKLNNKRIPGNINRKINPKICRNNGKSTNIANKDKLIKFININIKIYFL